jgi:hypothetical protein
MGATPSCHVMKVCTLISTTYPLSSLDFSDPGDFSEVPRMRVVARLSDVVSIEERGLVRQEKSVATHCISCLL